MPDEKKYIGWTDPLADQISGMQDFWLAAEGPPIVVDGTGVITLTAGYQNLDGSGTINTINGAQRNGQFAILRIGDTANISFGSSGNVRASAGARVRQRWLKMVYRDGFWEEQSIPFGDFTSGVLSWNNRTGEVVPLSGDYTATQVTATDPTGSGGNNVQTVLNNLKTAIDAVTPGSMVTSFNARTGTVVPISGDYTGSLVTMTPFTVGGETIPGPSVQEALEQIVAAIGGVAPGGVTSFKTRVGAVVPVLGDYTATIVGATDPTGLGGTQTQTVLNNLYTKIQAVQALIGDGSGIQSIITPGRTFSSITAGWPNMTLLGTDIPSTLSYSPIVSGNMGLSNDLAAGTVYSQLSTLNGREATKIKYDGTLGGGALNTDIRSAPSVGEALNRIPGGIVTAQGNNNFVGSNTFSGVTTFNGDVLGAVKTVNTAETTRSGSFSLAAGQGASGAIVSSPASGVGEPSWFMTGYTLDVSGNLGSATGHFNGGTAYVVNTHSATQTVSYEVTAKWIRIWE